MDSSRIDYYKILGLKRGATEREITAAYRAKALSHHPDKQKQRQVTTDSDQFIKIKQAYHHLMDPQIRAALDLRLLAEEERRLRDVMMDKKRKALRDDLLAREADAKRPTHSPQPQDRFTPTPKPRFNQPQNDPQRPHLKLNQTLKLKVKLLPSLSRDKPKLIRHISDLIENALGDDTISNLQLSSQTTDEEIEGFRTILVEFESSLAAEKLLQIVPFESIYKAEWLDGLDHPIAKPNPNLTQTRPQKPRYSQEYENFVLEKLLARRPQ